MVLGVRNAVAGVGLMMAWAGSVFAQSTLVPIVVTPATTLSFDITTGNPAPQVVNVSRGDQPNAIAPFTITSPSWITVADNATGTPVSAFAIMPINLRISVNRGLVPAGTTQGIVTLSGQGLRPTDITVNVTGSGTGTTSFSVTTSSGTGALSFTEANASAAQSIFVGSNTGITPTYTLTLTYLTGSGWLNVTPTPNTGANNASSTVLVTANPSGLTANTYSASLVFTPTNVLASAVSVPITLTVGTGGTRTLSASPNAITVTPATPIAIVTVTPSLNETVPVTMAVSSNLVGIVNFISAPTSIQPIGSTVSLQLVNAQALNISGFLTITPSSGLGYAPLNIPITVSSTGTTTRVLVPSPAQLNLSAAVPSTTVTVTPSTAQAVSVTAQITPSTYASVLTVSPSTTTVLSTGTSFTLFLIGAQSIPPNTSASLVITPSDATVAPLTVPITINGTLTVPGSGAVIPSPTSLTLDVQLGQTPQPRTITVQSSDPFTSVFFSALATSITGPTNWLSVTPLASTTPASLTVNVNSAAFTQAGTYSGNIALTPLISGVPGTTVNVPVTVNVTGAVTVAANPTAVTLNVAAGSPTQVTTAVQLTSTSTTIPNPSFTTTVTTANSQNWLSVASNSTVLPATLTVAVNPAALTQGTYTGNIAVNVTGAQTLNIPVTVTATAGGSIQLSPTSLTFNHQTSNTSGPAAQSVNVTSTGSAVTFNAVPTSTGNWLQVTPVTGTTPAALSVSVIPTGLTAGTYQGTIQISSSNAVNSPQTISVTLNVTTPAIPQVNSFVNAASQLSSAASPGLIFTIYGTDLGPATPVQGSLNQGVFGTDVGGTRVLFDGIAAPILYTSQTQVSAVVPFELVGRFSTRMQVEYRGVRSREIELRVAEAAPAVFTANSRGSGPAAALNQNGSQNSAGNAELPGNIVVLYATGFGQTTPVSSTGAVINDLRRPTAPVTVRIGGRDAEVVYVGSAPTFIAGAIQLNIRIPSLSGVTGPVPVSITVGGVTSQGDITVAVR